MLKLLFEALEIKKLSIKDPKVIFGLSQISGALVAVYLQSSEMQDADSTKSVTISVFFCMLVFDFFNAGLSYRIWRPVGKKLDESTTLNEAQKDAVVGMLFYMLSAIGYTVLLVSCLYRRQFQEIVPLAEARDFYIVAFAFVFSVAAYAAAKTITEEPFSKPYFYGVIGIIVAGVAQVGSGIHILNSGTQGVCKGALYVGLLMIGCKLAYYSYVRYIAKDRYRKEKAEGVLLAEFGNLASWSFVIKCFHATRFK